MSKDIIIDSFSKMVVVYTTRKVVSPTGKDDKDGRKIVIAVTLPGGFTGFGSNKDAACKMAVSRAKIAYKRASGIAGVDLTESLWFEGIWSRLSPALLDYLNEVRGKSVAKAKGVAKAKKAEPSKKRAPVRFFDVICSVENSRIVDVVRNSPTPFAMA